MARQRISDSDRAERVREWSRQASARRIDRLRQSGKLQLLCWIPAPLRAQLDATAAQRNQNLSQVTTALLSAALNPVTPARPALAEPDPLPLFAESTSPAPVESLPSDRDSRIRALKREQPELSNYAIASKVGCSEPTVRRVVKRIQEATG